MNSVPLLACLLGIGPGAAPVTTIAPVDFDGRVASHQRAAFDGSMREGLARTALATRSPAADCTDRACAMSDARAAGSRYLLVSTVHAALRTYELSVEVIDTTDDSVVVEGRESCAPCGLEEASAALGRVTAAVGDKLQRRLSRPTSLSIEPRPSDAQISIDGEVIGSGSIERELSPGPHVVEARRTGYAPQRREIDAVEGVHETIEFDLQRRAKPARSRAFVVAGGSLMGTGAAVSIGGAVLIGLHGRPDRSRCAGANIDADGDCAFVLHSRPAGIAAVTSGLTAIAVGAVLLVIDSRRRNRR